VMLQSALSECSVARLLCDVCRGLRTVVRRQLFAGQLITTIIIRADNYSHGQLSFLIRQVKGISWKLRSSTTDYMYTRLFAEVRGLIPTANPISVLTDFESATVDAFHQHYPATSQHCV